MHYRNGTYSALKQQINSLNISVKHTQLNLSISMTAKLWIGRQKRTSHLFICNTICQKVHLDVLLAIFALWKVRKDTRNSKNITTVGFTVPKEESFYFKQWQFLEKGFKDINVFLVRTSCMRFLRKIVFCRSGSWTSPSEKKIIPWGKLCWDNHETTRCFCISGRPVI